MMYRVYKVVLLEDPYNPHPWAVAVMRFQTTVHAQNPDDAIKFAKRLGFVAPVVEPV
jgi:ATP-dependent Clp protease adapter protein ClpS